MMTFLAADSDRWGDYPTWVSAGVALLALIAAGIAAWATLRGLSIERQRERQAQAEYETRDASRACAWIGRTPTTVDNDEGWRVFVTG
jgi:hypothetical protein